MRGELRSGAIVFAVVVGVATVAAQADVQAGSAAANGHQTFVQTCSRCHRPGVLPGERARGLANPQRRAQLDRFLSRHYARDPAQRAIIIDYLSRLER